MSNKGRRTGIICPLSVDEMDDTSWCFPKSLFMYVFRHFSAQSDSSMTVNSAITSFTPFIVSLLGGPYGFLGHSFPSAPSIPPLSRSESQRHTSLQQPHLTQTLCQRRNSMNFQRFLSSPFLIQPVNRSKSFRKHIRKSCNTSRTSNTQPSNQRIPLA